MSEPVFCFDQKNGELCRFSSEEGRPCAPCSPLTRIVIHKITHSPLKDLGRMNLAHFAREMDVSTVRLCRTFRRDTGHGLSRYVRTVKMVRCALMLLCRPDLRVRDVIEQAGFSCPDHFRRIFRSCFSRSPSDFRLAPRSMPSPKASNQPHQEG